MELFQLTAKGPLALNKGVTFRHSSRVVFLSEEEANDYKEDFRQMMTTPLDEKDIGYLDPENTKVSVVQLTIAGVMEKPVPADLTERIMNAIDEMDEESAKAVVSAASQLELKETLAEVIPISKAKRTRKTKETV